MSVISIRILIVVKLLIKFIGECVVGWLQNIQKDSDQFIEVSLLGQVSVPAQYFSFALYDHTRSTLLGTTVTESTVLAELVSRLKSQFKLIPPVSINVCQCRVGPSRLYESGQH